MRRYVVGLLLCALVAAVAVPVAAQDDDIDAYLRLPYKFTLFIDGGLAVPASPGIFNDLWNTTLPFTVGVGYVVFPWFEIAGSATFAGYGINEIPAKAEIGLVSVEEIAGGGISTSTYAAVGRFLAFPSQPYNPYVEFGAGLYNASLETLVVGDNAQINEAEDASGIAFLTAVGLQYALTPVWSVYTKVNYQLNLGDEFNPDNLLREEDEEMIMGGDSMSWFAISLGLMIKI